jgi:hypothetical protein
MSYFDPRLTEAYRKDTAHGFSSSGLDIRQKCKLCGASKRPGELVRKAGTSRHNPSSWTCRGGCNG